MWTNHIPFYSEEVRLKLLKKAPIEKLIEYLSLPRERNKP